ncbi:MAG: asparagine synthase-related protein [Candidatus Acidiferrales bacterium]
MGPEDLSSSIARLYARHGTDAFARLEGNFSLLISDPASRSVFLVVDKFGCDDVFIREEQTRLRFGSHPGFLLDAGAKFNALPAAFFLAHEGFVPAPFTLFDGVKTIGRGRFLRFAIGAHSSQATVETYWRPSRSWDLRTCADAVGEFMPLLRRAIEPRLTERSGLLLSGGADSSLLANLIAQCPERRLLALTGGIEGDPDSGGQIEDARALADALGISHEAIVLDPFDEALPEEWALCVQSWIGGTRITLPLFYRFAVRQREVLGEECSVLSGQMADTLADNNYTSRSLGYLIRRGLFSAKFLKLLPLAERTAGLTTGRFREPLIGMMQACAGSRIAGMLESVLEGVASKQCFYEGRLFGYGEMPGRSPKYFPSLTPHGFDSVADWYSSNFVKPIVVRLDKQDFYRAMIELSMDMVMLHLDARLVFHAFRLGEGRAEMPFLDSRVVNFFASLPDSARALHREPKHVIQAQFQKPNVIRAAGPKRLRRVGKRTNAISFEELLLGGTLGAYFRDLLAAPTIANRASGVFELIDERYLFGQLDSFIRGAPGVDYKFISRLGALELWSRMAKMQTRSSSSVRAIA